MEASAALVGVVDSRVLGQARALDLSACPVLEIRYDLFADSAQWPSLVSQVRTFAPHSLVFATIRLERDGGRWPDSAVAARDGLWDSILSAKHAPDWLDIEWPELQSNQALLLAARKKSIKVLASQHDFQGIPTPRDLLVAIREAQNFAAEGFKIAGMSQQHRDCGSLYALAQEHGSQFQRFSAFAMGATGMVSRLYSLVCGANLSYGALGESVAPGQIPMPVMRRLAAQLHAGVREDQVAQWLRAEGLLP